MQVLDNSEEQKIREINSAIAFAEYSIECLNYIAQQIRSEPKLVQTILGMNPDDTNILYNFCVSDTIRNLIIYDVYHGDVTYNICVVLIYVIVIIIILLQMTMNSTYINLNYKVIGQMRGMFTINNTLEPLIIIFYNLL